MVAVLFISAVAFLYGLTAFLFRDQLTIRRRSHGGICEHKIFLSPQRAPAR
jgi:hypothetical protein